MPLQRGTWKANINGMELDLQIDNTPPGGEINGYIRLQSPMFLFFTGYWDELSQSVSFYITHAQDTSTGISVEIEPSFYRGYRFSTPQQPAPGQDVVWTLAGSVTAFPSPAMGAGLPTTPNSRRNVFGWHAQISEVV